MRLYSVLPVDSASETKSDASRGSKVQQQARGSGRELVGVFTLSALPVLQLRVVELSVIGVELKLQRRSPRRTALIVRRFTHSDTAANKSPAYSNVSRSSYTISPPASTSTSPPLHRFPSCSYSYRPRPPDRATQAPAARDHRHYRPSIARSSSGFADLCPSLPPALCTRTGISLINPRNRNPHATLPRND